MWWRSFKNRCATRWGGALVGGLACAILGALLLLLPPFNAFFEASSYDLPFAWRGEVPPGSAIIVSMDSSELRELTGSSTNRWSRAIHARLLDKCLALGAEAVVFDIYFEEPSVDPEEDRALARSIEAARGRVILGAQLQTEGAGGESATEWSTPRLPTATLMAHAQWGLVDLPTDADQTLRRFYTQRENTQAMSLAWRAAELLGKQPADPGRSRWIRYYGPRGTVDAIGYTRLMEQPDNSPRILEGKVVFVGWNPNQEDGIDQHRTPYTRWRGRFSSGVEIHTTIFLNLVSRQWLERLGQSKEFIAVILIGLGVGWMGTSVRPWTALGMGALLLVGLSWLTSQMAWRHQVWASWLVPGAAQIPAALFWSFLMHWYYAREATETARSGATGTTSADREKVKPDLGRIPEIPDHELIRCIGRGAYGEVWLARDVIGTYHAVKIVWRQVFTENAPYEREFNGIQKFTPISRQHPGWVHILHVGRKDEAGCFYYVMELGDDMTRGQTVDPERYQAKNLALELARQGSLELREALALGAELADALGHLHQHGLIHRDIKPSNVIYVRGRPKFADIGLVTEFASNREVSQLGTEGYMAPEGPGTPAADIFSLGRLLYEAGLGRDPRAFPEMPTRLFELPDVDPLHRFYAILEKACARSPDQRHRDAGELKAELELLLRDLP